MSDEFREKAIKIIVDYSGASADELKSMADADLLAKYYDNYHFEEEIEDGDVKFSYMIKSGKATTRNAIKLLSVMGYDSSLVESAEKMSAGFLENGTWENVNYE